MNWNRCLMTKSARKLTSVTSRTANSLLTILISLLSLHVHPQSTTAGEAQEVRSRDFMVVAVSPPAVAAGAQVLEDGGSAVDAAVTVALAMAVTYPPAGNIGGGGFMMVARSDGSEPYCVDYREMAPGASKPDMFELGETRFSRKIVGVPGTLRGLELAHRRWGKLPWKRLVQPAVKLAAEGFELDAALAASLTSVWNDDATRSMTEFRRVFAPPDQKAWKAGDRLVQPDLAKTMRLIAEGGAAAFYEGPIADGIVAEMKRGDGIISKSDLRDYRAVVRQPIRTLYRGHEVLGPAPPSSGGICVAEMLNTLSQFDLKQHGRWSPRTSHLMIEAMRRAYLDRARYLGDPLFTDIPPHLLTRQHGLKLAKSIDPSQATDSLELADDIPVVRDGNSTTHFSVIDADGLGVSNTYTLEFSYGSRVVVSGFGFLLNNEMGDFNWKPGHTDTRGRIGTPANVIVPGKRMLSSQTPTIVRRNGKVVMLTGSPGGRTIINTVLCVLLNRLEFELSPTECVGSPRIHHQWLPDQVRYEDLSSVNPDLLESLKQMGHQPVAESRRQGDAHSIFVDEDTGEYIGVADPRINGAAIGNVAVER